MSERHADDAELILALTAQHELLNGTSTGVDAALVTLGAVANGYAHAQVHATLALVEQLRIANLITLAGWVIDSGEDDVRGQLDDFRNGLGDEIWKGLGL